MENFGDGIKKILLAGIGAVAVTTEKSKEMLDEMVKKGELTVEQGKALNEELKHNIKQKVQEQAAELLFDIPPESFLPAPKVTSSVITMTPRKTPVAQIKDEAFFFKVVKAAFGQRRKTLVNALMSVFGSQLAKSQLQQILQTCRMPLDIRGERLDIPAFAALAAEIQQSLPAM